jgi:hypothetical protein
MFELKEDGNLKITVYRCYRKWWCGKAIYTVDKSFLNKTFGKLKTLDQVRWNGSSNYQQQSKQIPSEHINRI